MMGITIYTQIGTTGTTVTAAYTNQAGAGGQVAPLVVIGGTGFREANRMILLPLASGDTGVRAVATIALTATTGTAGDIGVTLFKPLYVITVDESSGVISAAGFITGKTCGGIAVIPDDACIFAIAISQGANAMGAGAVLLEEN
jgi:phage tail sheath gpL-like